MSLKVYLCRYNPSKVKKSVCKPVAESSNLPVSKGKAHLPENLPNLQTMWHDRFIQEQVENCLKELSGLNKKCIDSKIKSQRGGVVDVYVNQRVKLPHEFVLAGTFKDRLNYNQLNITQWMAGFCRKLAMQYCYVEWSKVKLLAGLKQTKSTGSEEPMHKDIHQDPCLLMAAKNSKKQGQTYQKSAKSMPCVYFNDNSCTFTKHHETKGMFYRHICSYCCA